MTFASTWSDLLDECEALEDDATLITPLSEQRFRITGLEEDGRSKRPVVWYDEIDVALPLSTSPNQGRKANA